MKRLLAIIALLATLLPVAAQALVLSQPADAQLPACCRAHGRHHCMMTMPGAPSNAPRVSEKCPCLPAQAAATAHSSASLLSGAVQQSVALSTVRLRVRRAEASRRIARERSRHKRGPPAARLA